MNFHTILHRFVFAAALMGSASLGLVSCGDDAPPSANLGGDSSVEPQNCFRPNTGCECDNEGTTITCRPSENSCEMGTRVCAGGTWSACDTGEVGGSAQGAIGGSQQALQDRDDPCTACQPECVAEKDFDFGHRATSLADDYENVVGITIDSTTIPGRIALLAGSGMPEDLLTWDLSLIHI